MEMNEALEGLSMALEEAAPELGRTVVVVCVAIGLLAALGLFKPDVEGCTQLVVEGWEDEMPFEVRPEARAAFEGMAQEACVGLAADGVVRK